MTSSWIRLKIHSILLIFLASVKTECNGFECVFISPLFINLQTIDGAKSKHVATSLMNARLLIGLDSSMFGVLQFLYFDSTRMACLLLWFEIAHFHKFLMVLLWNLYFWATLLNVPWGSESLTFSDNISWKIRCLSSLLSLSLWWSCCCDCCYSMFYGSSFDSELDSRSYAFGPKYHAPCSSSSLPEAIGRQWCTDFFWNC